ncbi:MAG TPA: purine-nucleoside phosphorylase [Bacilli bacterium]|nr:purine-nucleoside phosphorylase [Bacilli bacterium]
MTPHIEAKDNEIAKTVIMPGDPLRAKYIAETYLTDYKLVNNIRGMLAYTGKYKDKEITVMASGMGMPSIGIYSYELYKFYNVDNIIRIGTAGSYTKDLELHDLILVNGSYSESSFAKTQNGCLDKMLYASDYLNFYIKEAAEELSKHISISNIHSSDVFYKENDNYKELYDNEGCMACEMESFALFHNANVLKKRAACILTVSNNLVTGAETTSMERQKSLNDMIILALESAIRL